MGADFRYASENSQLSIMETKWGLIPDMTGLLSFPEVMRIDEFMELCMTAKVIGAKQAQEYGLISKVCKHPMQEALLFAEELLARSPDAHAATKKMVRKIWSSNSERKTLFWESWYQMRLLSSNKNQKISVNNNTPGKAGKAYKNRVL